ncbi:MAG TPA: hypothetical protein VFX96_00315, partial [Pyrinomonadaceae bacterium]|nr:hypothetical protein [Pyrinomonadaceae bacterium]
IPGNHDYYDQLDGFRRQFRQPAVAADEDGQRREYELGDMQLVVPGFRRTQESSYLALRLPHDWWLWALDTEVGQLDERQHAFFQSLCTEGPPGSDTVIPPPKLIIASCAPTTVFGQLADANDEKAADAFVQLGVSQPFLPGPGRDFADSGDAKLSDGQCRLDLSGDVHHYARYWGPPGEGARAARREEGEGVPAPSAESYASVVSGLGGAFHHPSQTFAGQVREQALYPDEETSRGEVAERIFKFWNVKSGGSVHVIGFLLAFVIYFAVAIPQSSRQVLNNFWLLQWLGVAQAQPVTPTVSPIPATFDPSEAPDALAHIGVASSGEDYQAALDRVSVRDALEASAVRAVEPLPGAAPWKPADGPCAVDQPRYLHFFAPCRTEYTTQAAVGEVFLWLSLVVIGFGIYNREKIFGSPLKAAEKKPGGGKRRIVMNSKFRAELEAKPGPWLRVLVPLAFIFGFGGLYLMKPYRDHITPFGSSMIVFFSIIWAVAAAALAIRYSEHLHIKSFADDVDPRLWKLSERVLPILAIVSVAWGLWSFGRNNLPSLLVSDMLFIAVVTAAAAGVVGLGWSVAGDQKGPGAKNRKWFLLLGLWHAVLQVSLPFLLVRRGTWITWLGAVLLVAAPTWLVGERLMKIKSPKARRLALVAAWLVYGGLMLALSYLPSFGLSRPFMSQDWSGWSGLLPALAAGAAGAVLCCLWFGWYLGVALTLHGHNNEVGGAARIERFKEFVRVKLTSTGLTAYVIAVDEPKERGAELRPKLVDVFTLRVKGGA